MTFKELFVDAIPFIEKTTPLLAAALGCPYPATVALAINLLSKAFGLPKHDIPSLVKNILEDPESHKKLLEAESLLTNEHKELLINKLRLPNELEISAKFKWN